MNTYYFKAIKESTESEWRELYLAHAKGERKDIIPFPDEDIQVKTNNKKGESTAKGALAIFDCIQSIIAEEGKIGSDLKVLDYGCGWGRITRLLPYYFDIENIVGVDVDEHLIENATALLPLFDFRTIQSMEPLSFADNTFDIIFANSVFSHLSEKSCIHTLRELSRILKKDGLLMISVLKENEMLRMYSSEKRKPWVSKVLGEEQTAIRTLKKEGFLFANTGRWHEYGLAVMTDDWLIKQFESIGIHFRGSKKESQNYFYGKKK